MKILLLIPNNWMMEMVKPLTKYFEISTNEDIEADLVWCGSESQINRLIKYNHKFPDTPIINYLWDLYSFKVYNPNYIAALQGSKEIWTPTYDVSQDLKQDHDLTSYYVPCWFPTKEWEGTNISMKGIHVVQASRRDDYKRFDWFEKACQEMDIPYKSCHPDKYSRSKFKKIIAGCNFVVVSSLEESQGTLSAMEAVYLLKPVLMSDCIQGGKEVWGDTIEYFKWDSFEEYKQKIWEMYIVNKYDGDKGKARERLLKNHSLDNFINKFVERINQCIYSK